MIGYIQKKKKNYSERKTCRGVSVRLNICERQFACYLPQRNTYFSQFEHQTPRRIICYSCDQCIDYRLHSVPLWRNMSSLLWTYIKGNHHKANTKYSLDLKASQTSHTYYESSLFLRWIYTNNSDHIWMANNYSVICFSERLLFL